MTLDQAQAQNIAPWDDEIERSNGVRVYRDRYPVTLGHLLFVPESDDDHLIGHCFFLAMMRGRHLIRTKQCDGFNIGINYGAAAGQTVMYPHVHLIPRRQNDCTDPTGGVRAVITGQANYKSQSYERP